MFNFGDSFRRVVYFYPAVICLFFLASCSMQKQIGRLADENIFQDAALKSAHVGISVYDPAAGHYLYNKQADKYFVPASNTKLFSLYAGLKYLGDSLIGIRYVETDTAVFIFPSGDPTLLHPDFSRQPVVDFLKSTKKPIYLVDTNWKEQPLGAGWAWDDYNDDYSAERSSIPVYGNLIKWIQENQKKPDQQKDFPPSPVVYSIPDINWKVTFTTGKGQKNFFVQRHIGENIFEITEGNEDHKEQDVPFVTNGVASAIELLKDTTGKEISVISHLRGDHLLFHPVVIHSQLLDSLFTPMMHKSDNFFAEQTLLMVSNEKLGVMNDRRIIDTLLKNDLNNLPQRPAWVDGSGLSRYNLFTPQDFVWLLNTMKVEFGMNRMKTILPTGGKGTLGSYYKQDSGYIYAKTGSLSGVICLSGYLYTTKNRLLIFSVLVNNHNAGSSSIRKAVAKFIEALRRKY